MLDFAIDVSPEFVPVLSIQAVDVGAIEIRKKRHSAKAECPLDRSSADLPRNLRPLPAPVGQRPFLCRPRPCCSTQSLETRNVRKVAGVPPGRPAQIALQCEAGVERSRQADREDGKVRFDLDSPEGRLAALEVLGVIRYNEELAKTTSREMVVATAAGHEIVTTHSPYGLLHYINVTGKVFAELESAIQFAEENSA